MMEQNNNQAEQYASQERISKDLREIKEQHHIKILYAVESGSRAWGFSSPDSDWDVRFIYVHEPEWYFHIEEQKDTIEQMFPDETDMSGWDLKKTLRLFKSSNPSLFEWLNSPIIYQMDEQFIQEIRQMETQYFKPCSTTTTSTKSIATDTSGTMDCHSRDSSTTSEASWYANGYHRKPPCLL